MKKAWIGLMSGVLIFLLFPLTMGAQTDSSKILNLTLEEAITRALKNNLQLQIQILNPEISDLAVARAKEKFFPTLSFNFNRRSTVQASYSWLEATDKTMTDSEGYQTQLSQQIPTGGSLGISLNWDRTDTTARFQTINPRYSSTLRFTFSQPLLRDFGFKMSRREIIIAQTNLEISEYDLKKAIMDTIYSVEEAYWNLVYAIENLEVRRQALQLARELLEKNKKAVEIGTMASLEVLSAEAEVASREADIIAAEVQVKNAEDQLRRVLNLTRDESISEIKPVDKPRFVEQKVDLEECLQIALQNRPDLFSTRLQVENQEFNLSVARNQLLPNLSFSASYWSPGLSGDRILYLNDNPFTGVILGTIPGGASGALKDSFNFKYRNWSLSLTLDIPLSNAFSRANYAQAKLNLQQTLLRLKNQEEQVYLEVKNAVRAVQSNFQRVQAYRLARELAEKKLEAEQEKLRLGLSTNFMVLTYQRDLANQRTAELKAIIDYSLSLANLDRVLGTTLKTRNIELANLLERK
ncbi:MAG: TolC family protein [Candidatus Aminicenantes bacterium]|nr:TolC family protein [Candidatus Aminicenantes bacterium]